MSTDAWLTLGVLVALLAVLATERVTPVLGMGGAVLALLLLGVLDDQQAVAGFGNAAPVTIAALYVLAGAAASTGALGSATGWLVNGGNGSARSALARLTTTTAAMSAVVPNTPLVALIAPRIVAWCRRTGRSSAAFLMPLSYAAVLGGVITVLGTSTNLVVSDLLAASGAQRLGVFEITPVGLAVAAVGVATLVLLAPVMLRDRSSVDEGPVETARQFTVAMRVDDDGPLPGRSIGHAGLRHLQGVYLAAVERGGTLLQATPDLRVAAGDTLYFAGDVTRVVDLMEVDGLVSAEAPHLVGAAERLDASLFEAVVSERSELVGASLGSVAFRSRYGAAVLAIHRAGVPVPGKLGSVVLRPGDVLLVLAGADFAEVWRHRSDFAVIAAIDGPPPPRRGRARVVTATFVAMVALAASGLLSLLQASLAAAGAMVALRVVSPREARRSVNLGVVLSIALSITLGTAVATSGLALEMAEVLGALGGGFGDVGRLAAVLLATMLLTELLSNNGAAAVMFPVALAAATGAGMDPRPFAVAVLVGASCSFLSPIGYQTNLMVYGLGGYRFADFARLGAPLSLVTAVSTLIVLPVVMPLR